MVSGNVAAASAVVVGIVLHAWLTVRGGAGGGLNDINDVF